MKKKDGSFRISIDYRQPNKVTIKNRVTIVELVELDVVDFNIILGMD